MFVKKRKLRSFYLIALVALVLFLLSQFSFSVFIFFNSVASVCMYPVVLVQHSVVGPVKTFFKKRQERSVLERSLQNLRKKYYDLVENNIHLESLLSYHEQTTELIDFKSRYDSEKMITAQVLLKHMDDVAQFFLLGKGAQHGVVQDMVAVYKNCLVGRVSQVYPLYSKVILITDKSCKVAAHCAKTKSFGIHVGINSTESTALQRVSHLCSVSEGDMVFSSGEGLIFPQGFALGKIKTASRNGIYFDVAVEPIMNMQEVGYCVLMQKGAT